MPFSGKKAKEYRHEYYKRPEVKKRRKEYMKEYRKSPQAKEYMSKYRKDREAHLREISKQTTKRWDSLHKEEISIYMYLYRLGLKKTDVSDDILEALKKSYALRRKIKELRSKEQTT